ncbi:hypothetical protein CMI37_24670 [Candidatus Pacearchaeota archaeon]|jgi:hypothetical protein|nr:hypothetical protein [Candidatus Pacearchaeota archaeon]|tara:strand:+ start:8183 stop:8410 length:228 start_codon:yes stop_codon:yes gene_type:complete
MADLDEIKKTWQMPNGWSVRVDDKFMQVIDSEDEPVAQAMTQIHVIEIIQAHLDKEQTMTAYQMMLMALKNPIDC